MMLEVDSNRYHNVEMYTSPLLSAQFKTKLELKLITLHCIDVVKL